MVSPDRRHPIDANHHCRALNAVRAIDGPDEEFSLLGRLVFGSLNEGDLELAWALARRADRSVLSSRRDGAAVAVEYARLGEQDHLDPEHPGIMRDTPERRALRDLMCSLPTSALAPLWEPVESRAEAEARMEQVPIMPFDDRGLPIVPIGPLWVLGRARQFAEWLEASIEAYEARGALVPVMRELAFVARLRCALGEHDASDAAMAKANALIPRVAPTSNALFHVLAADGIRRAMRGEVAGADALAAMLPFVELPATSWAGLAVRASMVLSLGLEARADDALAALEPVLPIVDVAPGYAVGYPLVIACCIDALWALDRTDGLELLERNLRTKVVEPDVRYPEVDGRRSLALACALTGRIDEAETWFARSREVLNEDGDSPLLVAVDVDEAIMHQRIGTAASLDQAALLLDRAYERAAHPAMAPWRDRIETLRPPV